MLRESVQTRPGIGRYIGMPALGTAITFWGCCYLGAILSGSEYLLVLRLFRGVKRSQLTVYAGGMVLLAMAQWSAFLSEEHVPLLPLALVPVASRAAAAVAGLARRPMSTSQYSAMVRGGAPLYVAAAVLAKLLVAVALGAELKAAELPIRAIMLMVLHVVSLLLTQQLVVLRLLMVAS